MKADRCKYDTVPSKYWSKWKPPAPVEDKELASRYEALVAASFADRTWQSLESVTRSVDKIAKKFRLDLAMPWSSNKLLQFVLAGSTMWKADTIKQYVSRINSVHKLLGMDELKQTPWVKRVIIGLSNIEKEMPARLAVTPAWMKIIRKELCRAPWPLERKRLFWAVATLLFSGSLRQSEVLPFQVYKFKPDSTLLGSDIEVKQEKVENKWVTFMLLRIRSPKEIKATAKKSTWVELFKQEGQGSWLCPVKAFLKYKRLVRGNVIHPDLPAIRTKEGKGYTGDMFNKDLKGLLTKHKIYNGGVGILSHSFRAGVASTLARLGFPEETIAAQGRWSSTCYNR